MKDEHIRYRLERAEESLAEASLLAENAHFNTAINRLYYVCFYLADASLTQEVLSTIAMQEPKANSTHTLARTEK